MNGYSIKHDFVFSAVNLLSYFFPSTEVQSAFRSNEAQAPRNHPFFLEELIKLDET